MPRQSSAVTQRDCTDRTTVRTEHTLLFLAAWHSPHVDLTRLHTVTNELTILLIVHVLEKVFYYLSTLLYTVARLRRWWVSIIRLTTTLTWLTKWDGYSLFILITRLSLHTWNVYSGSILRVTRFRIFCWARSTGKMSNNTILTRNLRFGVVFDYELCGFVAGRHFSLLQCADRRGWGRTSRAHPRPLWSHNVYP